MSRTIDTAVSKPDECRAFCAVAANQRMGNTYSKSNTHSIIAAVLAARGRYRESSDDA